MTDTRVHAHTHRQHTDIKQEKRKKLSGLPDTSARAQKHKRRFIFHRIKNDYLSLKRIESTLEVCCEVLAICEQFSISCVQIQRYSCTWLALSFVNSLSTVCSDSTCAYLWPAIEELVINRKGFFFFVLFVSLFFFLLQGCCRMVAMVILVPTTHTNNTSRHTYTQAGVSRKRREAGLWVSAKQSSDRSDIQRPTTQQQPLHQTLTETLRGQTHIMKLISTTSNIQTKRNCCIQYIDDLWLVL